MVLDFAGRRTAASFDTWPEALRDRLLAVPEPVGRDLPETLDRYVEQAVGQLDRIDVRHVFAYCLSSGIGLELARGLRDAGHHDVSLVLFDPTRARSADLVGIYRGIVAEISRPGDPPPLDLDPDDCRDYGAVLRRVRGDVLRRVGAAIDVDATDDPLVLAVAGRYLHWFGYFALAAQAPWTRPSGLDVARVYSAEQPAVPWPGGSDDIRVDVSKDALLTSPVVHRLAAGLLSVHRETGVSA